MGIKQSVRQYILENYLFTDNQGALADSESLLEKGIIDSTGVLELVMFLEEAFGIAVDDDELTPEYLDSVDAIAAFVGTKQAGRQAAEKLAEG